MTELKYKLIKRRRGDPVQEEQVIDYCTLSDGRLALAGIADATLGERHDRSVHYIGRDGENWIAELKRVYE